MSPAKNGLVARLRRKGLEKANSSPTRYVTTWHGRSASKPLIDRLAVTRFTGMRVRWLLKQARLC
jgi:hypothetical protein